MIEFFWIAIIYVVSACAALHVLLYKRDPRSALGWIAVCLGLPGVGALLYVLLGFNRIRNRARSWQDCGIGIHSPIATHEIPAPLIAPYQTQNYQLLRQLSDNVTRRPLISGNCVQPLFNGDQAFPEMLAAIADARSSIALSTYIFDTQQSGRVFVDALCLAAERGVEVRVLIDGLGGLYSWPRAYQLFKGTTVKVSRFLPFTFLRRGLHFNLRNHRKLLVIDGELGFTGGMNISQRHVHERQESTPRPVVDIHFRVVGPVVGQMQEAFCEDWNFATGETFHGRSYPEAVAGGESLCRGISAGPNETYEKLVWIVVGALNCARRRVSIMTPYFIPDRTVVSALNAAVLRGVEVEIILPQKNNLPFVHWASRGSFWELLEYGVKLYYTPGPFVHSKLLLMDDHYALIGSANMDPRSLRLNFEFNLEVYDKAVNEQLRDHFDGVRLTSTPITLREIEERRVIVKLRDNFCRLFSPFL